MTNKKRLRDKYFQIWVTEKEKEMIKEKAKYCRMDMSKYGRQMLINGVIIKRDFKDIFYELNKIGVNINQIAKKANERGSVIEHDIEELRVQYEKMFELYYEHILNG